jgi:very-short-patch-repair endonuclease
MDIYEKTGEMRHDPYFMDWEFSPIERHVWGDIRGLGIPFFPQLPVLNYFIDFGCPFLKIGIECDGKEWHDYESDKARDDRLAAQGWMIFRIEGHKCCRIIEPFEDIEEDEKQDVLFDYFTETSEGILSAIKRKYFDDLSGDKYHYLVEKTLLAHRSTPETFPEKKKVVRSYQPTLFNSAVDKYIEYLVIRSKDAA